MCQAPYGFVPREVSPYTSAGLHTINTTTTTERPGNVLCIAAACSLLPDPENDARKGKRDDRVPHVDEVEDD